MHWYVVQTKPKNEDLVTYRLSQAGVEVLNPKIEKYIYRKGKKILGYESLFPNYIFAYFDLDRHYRLIKWTHGVNRIVGNGDIPIPIDNEVIECIKDHTNTNGIIIPTEQFNKGDRVRIKTGPFKNLIGILERPVSRKGRIQVLLELINYQCKIEIHQSEIEKY